MSKQYKLKNTLERLFGARKAKSLIKGLKEDLGNGLSLESLYSDSVACCFVWGATRQGHEFWYKVDENATGKIKGYKSDS